MGAKDSGKVEETASQKAMMQQAASKFQDYQNRWSPVISSAAQHVEALNSPTSPQRMGAQGRASSETRAQFGMKENQVESKLSDTGAAPGSGRFNAAMTGMSADEAKSVGMNENFANQAVDKQYVAGLTDLMQLGQGQSAQAGKNMSGLADLSGKAAAADAAASAAEKAGQMKMIGSVGGAALGYGMGGAGGQTSAQSGAEDFTRGYTSENYG